MKIEFTNINLHYADGILQSVQAQYQGYDEDRTFSLSGTAPIAADEYEGNEPVQKLENLVRRKVSNELLSGIVEE